MTNEEIQAERTLLARIAKLERAIQERTARVQALQAQLPPIGDLLNERPRRYSLEYEFAPIVPYEGVTPAPQTKSFLVDGGRPFLIDSIDTSLRVTGQAAVRTGAALVAGQDVSITLPFGLSPTTVRQYRNEYFDFFWSIRDTTTDRAFQNVRQPSVFLLSGALGPVTLPIDQKLPGGSEVEMTIEPTFAVSTATPAATFGKFFNVRRYTLQVSFMGRELL